MVMELRDKEGDAKVVGLKHAVVSFAFGDVLIYPNCTFSEQMKYSFVLVKTGAILTLKLISPEVVCVRIRFQKPKT